jgi:hypothetical protein
MPFFNHITTRVMNHCSIAVTESVQLFHYSHFVWFIFFKHVPSLNFLFFLSPAHVFQFSAVIFYRQCFSEFCRIHLKFLLPFQIPYLASIFFSFYSTCLVVLVVYVPSYWMLVHYVTLHSIKTKKIEHTSENDNDDNDNDEIDSDSGGMASGSSRPCRS